MYLQPNLQARGHSEGLGRKKGARSHFLTLLYFVQTHTTFGARKQADFTSQLEVLPEGLKGLPAFPCGQDSLKYFTQHETVSAERISEVSPLNIYSQLHNQKRNELQHLQQESVVAFQYPHL